VRKPPGFADAGFYAVCAKRVREIGLFCRCDWRVLVPIVPAVSQSFIRHGLQGLPPAVGEILSTFLVLGVGTGCLILLLGGTDHGRQLVADQPPVSASPTPTLVPRLAAESPALPVHLFIIVVGEASARDYRAYLAADALVRERIGEVPRDAEVLVVASESDAITMAAVIADQSSIPGFGPVTTVVIR
jgi:hypothetical protein